VIWRDVDERVLLVPGREVRVDVRFYRAERAGDEGEDAGDFGFYVLGQGLLVFLSFGMRLGRREESTS
jgi:hypothetical protein